MKRLGKIPTYMRRGRELRQSRNGNKGFRRTIMFPTLVSLISALLGALIGGGITAYTSKQSIDAQQAQQRIQLEEQRNGSIRSTRIKVYRQFLSSIDKSFALGQEFGFCVKKNHEIYLPGNTGALDKLHRCKGRFKKYMSNMSQSTFDDLAIYGSKDALAGALNYSVNMQLQVDEMATKGFLTWDEGKRVATARAQFAQIMCKDLNPIPRADCFARPSPNWPLPF
ncbi:hypothetical protein [Nonomuraea insulae]|uniref:Uncharacterized protein n=1 Tax=Nonomuraea insulae TaxID=1616787 RepID=A0ABW1D2D2_9ACTN